MIDAIYYDGVNSRRHPVTILIHKRVVAMRGAGLRRNARLSQMDVSERLQHAPRILRFPDGAFIEANDHKRLDKMLAANRFKDTRVVRWQNNWPLSLLALVVLLASMLSIYQWGVPAAAESLSAKMPASFGKKIGDQGFAAMEKQMLKPSTLPMDYQQHLRARFASLAEPRGQKTPYRLEFRSGKMGANAFALPNGVIVITDDMIKSAESEEALLGVLCHELGHVQRRHSTRQLLQSAGVGIVLNIWVGDVSTALAAVPAVLANLKHSRDFEREADRYAIDMMLANKLPLEPMAALFESMSKPSPARDEEDDEDEEPQEEPERRREPTPDYLSSHPSDAERIAVLRGAQASKR
ncbi:MAG: M48 family metallopeptidase [Pseudomonadota bacterium]